MSGHAGVVAVRLLQWLFPTDELPALLRGREAADWLVRAQRINVGLIVVFLPTMLGCMAGVTWLLYRMAGLLHSLRGPAVVDVNAPWMVYAMPGLLLGIGVAGAIVYVPLRLWLGADDYRKYEWAASVIAEYDGRRAGKWVVAVLLPPLLIFLVLVFDWGFRVTATQVQQNAFLGLGTAARPLADVRAVWLVRDIARREGKDEEKSYLAFDFRDGTRWDTAAWSDWPGCDAEAWAGRLKNAGLEAQIVCGTDHLPPDRR